MVRTCSLEGMRNLGCELLAFMIGTGLFGRGSFLTGFGHDRVTYLNTSSFAFYLLPFGLRTLWRRSREGQSGYKPPRCV